MEEHAAHTIGRSWKMAAGRGCHVVKTNQRHGKCMASGLFTLKPPHFQGKEGACNGASDKILLFIVTGNELPWRKSSMQRANRGKEEQQGPSQAASVHPVPAVQCSSQYHMEKAERILHSMQRTPLHLP